MRAALAKWRPRRRRRKHTSPRRPRRCFQCAQRRPLSSLCRLLFVLCECVSLSFLWGVSPQAAPRRRSFAPASGPLRPDPTLCRGTAKSNRSKSRRAMTAGARRESALAREAVEDDALLPGAVGGRKRRGAWPQREARRGEMARAGAAPAWAARRRRSTPPYRSQPCGPHLVDEPRKHMCTRRPHRRTARALRHFGPRIPWHPVRASAALSSCRIVTSARLLFSSAKGASAGCLNMPLS